MIEPSFQFRERHESAPDALEPVFTRVSKIPGRHLVNAEPCRDPVVSPRFRQFRQYWTIQRNGEHGEAILVSEFRDDGC